MVIKTKKNKKDKKSVKALKVILIIFIVLVFTVGGFFLGRQTHGEVTIVTKPIIFDKNIPEQFNFSLMKEVLQIINEDFVDKEKIDYQKMFYSLMSGMVAGLEDPYTVFLDPEQTEEFTEDIDGKFEGIGAEIAIKEGRLTIVAPLPNSPAKKAGLQPGDKVLAVDGKDTAEMNLIEAVKLIRGEKGTVVKLLIAREDLEPFEVEVTRDVIYIESVKTDILRDNIGYIEISSFNTDTISLFNEAVGEMKKNNVEKLVLDLRNNPGGLLEAAIKVASAWITNSDVVVIEKFGDGRTIDYKAKGDSSLKNMETVVLINNGSASGSEIVAGALKDYDQATLVGVQTFGKGSVQSLETLSDNSSIKITIAKWLTPKGLSISEEGISPDMEVEFTKEDFEKENDPQLDKALEILGEKE